MPPKTKIGRPPLPDSRRTLVMVRVSDAERRSLVAAARAARTTLSAYVRDAALRDARR